MIKKNPFVLLLLLVLASCTGTQSTTTETATASKVEPAVSPAKPHIDVVRQQFAPDKRVALFDVEPKGNVLRGETNMSEAKADLLKRLQAANVTFVDSIQVLPEAELGGKHYAVVTISVANIRSKPTHSAELATQATMGTPLKVWKKQNGWYLVQTPDHYLSWVDYGGIALMDQTAFNNWQQGKKLIYTKTYGFAHATADRNSSSVSDMVYGDVMVLKNKTKDFYEVAFPDGRTGFVAAAEAMDFKEWVATRKPTEDNLVASSKEMLGMPYLWGGTSVKGMDCSGFTKTIFFMNGLVLPRDASQQVHIGELVNTDKGWDDMRPGDLLFFGVPAEDGKPERVVHVGMWIGGNQEFIHSAGRVRINSMNPSAENHDASELARFLRAKRVSPEATLVDLREKPLYE
ncbi:C40 family peptidase [Pontibacter sp. HSC-36F09]|uniref:C40 family peptidase n=1 Tax=Pontibacter sp. HSC-36F09 TaxID=2910966 RepID=UPI00209FE7DA|nr:C40 family peptidase [Pontibacter sp. HSC-36F09]MCP2043404.1 cell wall-associated NlpC family hydrolase [Pontibacter sp. HSC-36F09]